MASIRINTFGEGNKAPVQLMEDGSTRPLLANADGTEKGTTAPEIRTSQTQDTLREFLDGKLER